MSMCAIGMAAEFNGKIAVNALWPKTGLIKSTGNLLDQFLSYNVPFIIYFLFIIVFNLLADCFEYLLYSIRL